jgi:hypothetical protein
MNGNQTLAESKENELRQKLTSLINEYSLDTKHNTQDFLLADYLLKSLNNLWYMAHERQKLTNKQERETWVEDKINTIKNEGHWISEWKRKALSVEEIINLLQNK